MKRKKSIKQQILQITYSKPAMDKKVVSLKQSLGELSAILNSKNKKS